jgi:serine/threonine protein kinase
VLRLFSRREEMPHFMMQVVLAVEQLHSLGLVHRALRPDVIFQSKDPFRPVFIGGLQYTT